MSTINLKAISDSVNKTNNDVTIIEIEGLNHLFQEAVTGMPTEYATIEQTFSPKALNIITDWILKRVR